MNYILNENQINQKWIIHCYCEVCGKDQSSPYGYGDYILDETYYMFKKYEEIHRFCNEHKTQFDRRKKLQKIKLL